MQNLNTENMHSKEQLDWECRESTRAAEASIRPVKVGEALGLSAEILNACKGNGSSGIKDYYDVTLASVSTHQQMVRRRQVFNAVKAKKPELSFVSARSPRWDNASSAGLQSASWQCLLQPIRLPTCSSGSHKGSARFRGQGVGFRPRV